MSLATEIKVSHSCDARACCPGNVLEAKRGFHFVRIGEILEIIADDEDVKYYMPIWAKQIGHEFIKIIDCGHCYKIWIRKMK